MLTDKKNSRTVLVRNGMALLVLMMCCLMPDLYGRQQVILNRGVVASRANTTSNQALVSWRFLETDPIDIAFNVYRSAGGGAATKLNAQPITSSTNFLDKTVNFNLPNTYSVRPVIDGTEQPEAGSFTLIANPKISHFVIPVDYIESPDPSYSYVLNDCATGDLDGDGQYDLIVKWDPTNAKDNSQSGVTGCVYLDAYKLDGTKLWRINLGPNIRAGAHYTQMSLEDFDGDGKAELAVRTSELTTFGDGTQIGDTNGDGITNYVNGSTGYILSGPEFLSVIEGATGKELARVDFIPRGPESEWNAEWGDTYGNRIDRFLTGAGYFNGEYPSILISRGYYKKTVVEAWDFRNGQLTRRWNFTADSKTNSSYRGQGNHNLVIGDVDGDGKDEVTFGACAIDDDGTPLYNTQLGHGDAIHLSDMDPRRPGLEVWQCHESKTAAYGSELRDAATGEILFGVSAGEDVGRAMAADIDPNHIGYEIWTSRTGGVRNIKGEVINTSPPSMNFGAFWSGKLNRDLLDKTSVTSYREGLLLDAAALGGAESCNGTKATPNLSADILGDWREEIIFHDAASRNLLVFVSPHKTAYRFITLMQDPLYHNMVISQNTAYNQPPHLSYYLGSDLGKLIANRNVVTGDSLYVADAGYDYDSIRWSNGASGRTATLKANGTYDTRVKFTADIYFKGSWFRDSLYVTFKSPYPVITSQPEASATLCAGDGFALSVTADATGGITGYQWTKDGESIPGAVHAQYTATANGVYRVNVFSNQFSTASEEVTLQFTPYPTLTGSLPDATFCPSGSKVLTVQADPATAYQWYRNGQLIDGETKASYTATAAGTYYAEVSNGACTVRSNNSTITLHPAPQIQLTAQYNVLQVVSQDNGLTYAWYKDTQLLPDATTYTYQAMSSGLYRVTVTNANGCQTSSEQRLTQVTAADPDLPSAISGLYPNPAQQWCVLQTDPMLREVYIEITDMSGKTVLVRQEHTGGTYTLDLSGIPAGMYTVTVISGGHASTVKLKKD